MLLSQSENLENLEGGLREFEVILHSFNLSQIESSIKEITAEAIIYSVNGNRDIAFIYLLNNPKWSPLEDNEKPILIRKGICGISDLAATTSKTSNKSRMKQGGSLRLDEGFDLQLTFDFSTLKKELKKRFLEVPCVVFLRVILTNPIECFTNDGCIYVNNLESLDDTESESGVRHISKESPITFDYSLIEGDPELGIDPYQRSPNIWNTASVYGTIIDNFDWKDGKLVAKDFSKFDTEIEEDIPF